LKKIITLKKKTCKKEESEGKELKKVGYTSRKKKEEGKRARQVKKVELNKNKHAQRRQGKERKQRGTPLRHSHES